MSLNKKQKKILNLAIIISVIIALVSGALFFLKLWDSRHGTYEETQSANSDMIYNGEKYKPKEDVETFLLLGLDKFNSDTVESFNNDKQADFLMLLVFDNASKKTTAIHINRDTMVDINVLGVAGNTVDTVNRQIALAHTYGNGRNVSCRNTAESVSKLLSSVKVDHYASLTMDSVGILNDLAGGVTLEVLDDFGQMDPTLVKGKTVTLLGEHALNYVRTRKGLEDSTNNNRMLRQRQYLTALYDKVNELSDKDESFLKDAIVEISDYIVSDRSVNQLQEIANKINGYEFTGIVTLDGSYEINNDLVEFYPDAQALQKLVIDLFYTKA